MTKGSARAAIYLNVDYVRPFDTCDLAAVRAWPPLADLIEAEMEKCRALCSRSGLSIVGEHVDIESPLRAAGYKRRGYQLPGLLELDRSIRNVDVVVMKNLLAFRSFKDTIDYFRSWIRRGTAVLFDRIAMQSEKDLDLLVEMNCVDHFAEEFELSEAPELGPGRVVITIKRLRGAPPRKARRIVQPLGRPRLDLNEREIRSLWDAGLGKSAIKERLKEQGLSVSLRTVGRRVELFEAERRAAAGRR